MKPKSEVMRVFAYDLDDGENSKLSYNFSENGLFSKYFRIDKETGVVYLQEPLIGVSFDIIDKLFAILIVLF